jgi:acetolactate synthase-1/2/3 large subunit
MFGNPLPAHFVARAEGLATLTIIANNQAWHAVRAATTSVYPDGHAVKANIMPLVALTPSPEYERVVETCGGVGFRVTKPGELKATLAKALDAVRAGTPAVVNVFTQAR